MQLEKESYKQLYRLIDAVLKEACYDYSYSTDLAVVNMNGSPLIFSMRDLKTLNKIKVQLDKEVENE